MGALHFAIVAALACAAQGAAAQATVVGKQARGAAPAQSVARTSSLRSQFVLHCAGCHGLDAAGSTVGQVPDMRQLGRFLRVEGGREFIIQVPGVMGSGLSDQQVAEVTNWVLGTVAADSLPPAHQPYSADEVRRARAAPLLDVAATRAGLVERARARGLALD